MSHDEDEARKHRVVADARARARVLGTALAAFAVIQLLAAATTWLSGRMLGVQALALLGIMLAGPGAIVLLAGIQVRALRGWNLVYAGLVSAMGLWGFVLLTLGWTRLGQFSAGPLVMIVGAFVLVFWAARKAEDPHIRAARSLVEPRGPVDASDRMPF